MKIEGSYTFPVSRQQVWDSLIDPECLARCMPGCEKLEVVGKDEYTGTINVGVAAIKGVYNGKVKIGDKQPPGHYHLTLDGRARQGFIRGSGTVDLEEKDGRTLLKYAGDVQIGGPLASVGQRMFDGVARMMIGQFFTAMEAEVRANPGEEVRRGSLANLFRYFWRLMRERVGHLLGYRPLT